MKPLLPNKDGRVEHPIKADALKTVADKWKTQGKLFKMGMVFPVCACSRRPRLTS